MDNNEEFTPERTEEQPDNAKPLPKLYSEQAIMGFAFFCSTLFASFLTIENMRQANAKKGILPVIVFTVIYTALEGFIFSEIPLKYRPFSLAFNLLGGVILNLFFWKRYIPADLAFEVKPIRKPLLIVIVFMLILLAISGLGGLAPK